jgi:hypothetical protein
MSQGSKGGFAFGGFFTFATAPGQFPAGVVDRALEQTIVVGAGGGNDVVTGGFGGVGLKEFLQLAFGIFEDRNDGKLSESAEELAQNEFACGLEPLVQEDSAQKRLEGVSQGRGALATAGDFLAAAEDEVAAEAELTGALGQAATVDEFGAGFGERTFAEAGELFVKFASQGKLEDSIAEKLEALIGLKGQALLVRDGGMCQSQTQ